VIENEFIKVFTKKLEHRPTDDQVSAIASLAKFTLNIEKEELFILKGYAGTGKTTLIDGLVKATNHFKIKTILLAPTGRAAKVINRITNKSAYTIHKKIYRQKSSKDGFGNFALGDNLHTNTLFIIDESSMIANHSLDQSAFGTGSLLDDLIRFVFSGVRCKILFIGDVAQLPPVKLDLSPALDEEALKRYMYPVFSSTLKQVVRQEKDSGILFNATELRKQLNKDSINIQIITKEFSDIEAINGELLIESLSSSYDNAGLEQSIIICRSNKRANRFNQGIRNAVLYKEERISVGDLIMVVKNSYFWTEDEMDIDFIANGDIAEIVHIFGHETMYGFDFADVTIRLIDYSYTEINVKILLNTLETETPALSYDENKKLFYTILEDYTHIKPKKKQYEEVRSNPYFNAIQIKYAYAITCHKAQGGQWQNVFIDQGYINDKMIDNQYLRWLYTAFTRPTKQLFLINFDKKMLDIDEF
jgi:exodeoxyribonuclease-5